MEDQNSKRLENPGKQTDQQDTPEVPQDPPSYEEVQRALGELKNNKSSRQDGISTELLKYGSRIMTSVLYELMKKI